MNPKLAPALVRAVAQGRVASPEALFIDIYNTAREAHAPDLPVVSSERYLPPGFIQAVQAELKSMTAPPPPPPPPPPPKPEPTMDDLIARMVSRVTGGKVDEVCASQGAIREHMRKIDSTIAAHDSTQKEFSTLIGHLSGRVKALENKPHTDMAAITSRVRALEERPTQLMALDQLEARVMAKFNSLKTELEETIMDLMAAEPTQLVPQEDLPGEHNTKFKVSICDPLVIKFAGRIASQAPANMKLIFENMDNVPPHTLGSRHFAIISGRARKQWVDAFRSRLPTERVIMTDRLGTTNLLKILNELSKQPYFDL